MRRARRIGGVLNELGAARAVRVSSRSVVGIESPLEAVRVLMLRGWQDYYKLSRLDRVMVPKSFPGFSCISIPGFYDSQITTKAKLSPAASASHLWHGAQGALEQQQQQQQQDEYIWIDQVCMDQANIAEKNSQVSLISDVFARAERVRVWLNADFTDWKFSRENAAATEGRLGLDEAKIKRVLEDKYFTRLWAIPEMLAREITVCVSETWAAWEELGDFALARERTEFKKRTCKAEGRITTTGHTHPDLATCIASFSSKECSDPRDNTYALLGLVDEKNRISIDHGKSVYQVYADAVQALCTQYAEYCTSRPSGREHYTQALSALRASMGFVESEEQALRACLDDMWRQERLEDQTMSKIYAMGFKSSSSSHSNGSEMQISDRW